MLALMIKIIFWILCTLYLIKLLINVGHLAEVGLRHAKGNINPEDDALLLAPETILLPLAALFFGISQGSVLLGLAFFLGGILALVVSLVLGGCFAWIIKKGYK